MSAEVRKKLDSLRDLDDAMNAISRSTNSVPMTRIEWLVIAFIASQTIGNIALLIGAIRGHQ